MAVSFKSSGLSARSLGILADRARNYLLGPGFLRVMGDAGRDLAARQQALIDSRQLRPLSASRIAQRIRNRVPFGPNHPLKATGQLHGSITGGARRLGNGVVAAIAQTSAKARTPERPPKRRFAPQPSNAQLVTFHKATGRDITRIPADFVAHWRAVIFERLRAAILTGRSR